MVERFHPYKRHNNQKVEKILSNSANIFPYESDQSNCHDKIFSDPCGVLRNGFGSVGLEAVSL